MKKILLLCLVCFFLVSCGKRGSLEPYEKEDVRYPRQYPSSEIKNAESIRELDVKV